MSKFHDRQNWIWTGKTLQRWRQVYGNCIKKKDAEVCTSHSENQIFCHQPLATLLWGCCCFFEALHKLTLWFQCWAQVASILPSLPLMRVLLALHCHSIPLHIQAFLCPCLMQIPWEARCLCEASDALRVSRRSWDHVDQIHQHSCLIVLIQNQHFPCGALLNLTPLCQPWTV